VQSEIKDISGCLKEITITVSKEEAQRDYVATIRDFSKYAVVPGFRKGKAPLSMVVNMFGNRLKENYLNEKVGDYYKEVIKEEDILPLYEPHLVDVKWEPNEDLVAVFRYEVAPVIEVNNYTGLDIEHYQVDYSDEMLEEYIEIYIKRKLTVFNEDIEVVGKDCVVIFAQNKDDDKKSHFPPELSYMNMRHHTFGDEFEEKVLGAKIGDVINATVKLKDDKTQQVSVVVEKIAQVQIPEVNDEFAKSEGFDNLEELRSFLKEKVLSEIQAENENYILDAINVALIKANNFDLPPTMVHELSKSLAQPYAERNNQSVDELAQHYYDESANRIKIYFIMKELLETLELEHNEDDERAVIKELADEIGYELEEFLEKNPFVTDEKEFLERLNNRKLYDYLKKNNNFIRIESETEETDDVEEPDVEK